MNEVILDNIVQANNTNHRKSKYRKLLWFAIALGMMVNNALGCLPVLKLTIYIVLLNGGIILGSSLISGFLIGLLIASIPYKNLTYSQKYLPAFEWSTLVTQLVIFAGLCYLVL